jgi:hypothetical protein
MPAENRRRGMPLFSETRLLRINRAVVSGRILPYLVVSTALVTLAAALAVRLLAHDEFDSFGESAWWAAQTVTTVGYGDVVPQTAFSKIVAVVVMFFGVAAVSLVTAVVTSAFISYQQRRFGPEAERHRELVESIERIEQRLTGLEKRL